jgi:hypothetical protein
LANIAILRGVSVSLAGNHRTRTLDHEFAAIRLTISPSISQGINEAPDGFVPCTPAG